MEFLVGGYTDKGNTKAINQDAFCLRRALTPEGGEMLLAVVCDGMGGGNQGELASKTCVENFSCWFDNNLYRIPSLCSNNFDLVVIELKHLINEAHIRLKKYGEEHQIRLGTTLVLFFAYSDRWCSINVGDSRVYVSNGRSFRQLSRDHSLVEREIALGNLTRDQSYTHAQKNILLQCIGVGNLTQPHITEGLIAGNNLYLLCTDGLTHVHKLQDFERKFHGLILSEKAEITQLLETLVSDCRKEGENDDITVLVVIAQESSLLNEKSKWYNKILKKKIENTSNITILETADIVHTSRILP